MTMSDVFASDGELDFSLTEAEEAAMIARAQAGDDRATMTLIHSYGPTLRRAVSEFKGGVLDGQVSRSHSGYGTPSLSVEDLQQAAIEGLLECLQSHDPARNPRLAGRARAYVSNALKTQAGTTSGFRVPERTLTRFYGIMAAADGDLGEALQIAPEKGMSTDTLLQVYAAVGFETVDRDDEGDEGGNFLDGATPIFTPSPVVEVEDKILVEHAFGAVTDEEASVCRYAYGFATGDPLSDGEIVQALSETALGEARVAAGETVVSRAAVQRRRSKALGKMREALGVTPA